MGGKCARQKDERIFSARGRCLRIFLHEEGKYNRGEFPAQVVCGNNFRYTLVGTMGNLNGTVLRCFDRAWRQDIFVHKEIGILRLYRAGALALSAYCLQAARETLLYRSLPVG